MATDMKLVGVSRPQRYPPESLHVDRPTPPPSPPKRLSRPYETGDRTLNASDPIPIEGEPSIRPSSRAEVRSALRPRAFAELQDRELEAGHFAYNRRLAAERDAKPARSARSRR